MKGLIVRGTRRTYELTLGPLPLSSPNNDSHNPSANSRRPSEMKPATPVSSRALASRLPGADKVSSPDHSDIQRMEVSTSVDSENNGRNFDANQQGKTVSSGHEKENSRGVTQTSRDGNNVHRCTVKTFPCQHKCDVHPPNRTTKSFQKELNQKKLEPN